jgi:hypothetical protein
MKRILIFVLVMEVFAFKAQAPKRFYTAFGGNEEDVGYAAKPTLDGNYIIAGSTIGDNKGTTDAYLVKLDSMGNILWQKLIGGIGNEVAKSIIQLADSGFVFTGFTNSYGVGGYDAYIVRTDKSGSVIWQKTFGGTNWDFANDLVLSSDGSLIVVGYTESFGLGKKDGFVLKYDLSGNLIWQKIIGGTEDDELKAIIKTNDNYLASVGYITSTANNSDIYFTKMDLNGDTLFTRTIGGQGKDLGNDLVQKANGQYIICGSKTFTNSQYTRSYMYSFTSIGTFTWENNNYSSFNDEEMVALSNSFQDQDYTGYLRNVPVPSFKTQGNILIGRFGGWPIAVNSFGGYEEETFYSIEGTKDGGYICTGRTTSFSEGISDVFFIKLDSNMVTYSNIVGVHNEPKMIDRYYLSKKDKKVFDIRFEKEEIPLTIKIYDLGGRVLYNINDSEIDLSQLSEGLYIIGIFLNNKTPIFFKIINE